MNDPAPSVAASVMYYAGMVILLTVVLTAVLWALERFAGVVMQLGSVGWLPAIAGAMQTGRRYGLRMAARPTGGYAWCASLGFVIVNLILAAPVVWLLMRQDGATMGMVLQDLLPQGIGLPVVIAILAGIVLLLWLLLRFSFAFGAGLGVKAALARRVR
jgi:hypothetical protein